MVMAPASPRSRVEVQAFEHFSTFLFLSLLERVYEFSVWTRHLQTHVHPYPGDFLLPLFRMFVHFLSWNDAARREACRLKVSSVCHVLTTDETTTE